MLQIKITPGSDVPLFRQIIDQIQTAVAVGDLEIGDPLPSVRSLASDLVINPNTIAKAYSELLRDGIVESHRGKGYFVSERRNIFTKKERVKRISALVQPLVIAAKTLDFDDEEIIEIVRQHLSNLSANAESTSNSRGNV